MAISESSQVPKQLSYCFSTPTLTQAAGQNGLDLITCEGAGDQNFSSGYERTSELLTN
jgi:hypothetical protein